MNSESAYVKTNDFKAIMFPNKSMEISDSLRRSDQIQEYLVKIFDSGLYFFREKLSKSDDIAGDYTGIVVKLILTNRDRTGLWVVHDDQSNEVSLLGGHVDYCDVTFIRNEAEIENPLVILQETLVRELYEELYGEPKCSVLYDNHKDLDIYPVVSPLTTVHSILYNRVKIITEANPKDLWYLYKFPGQEDSRILSFYYVIECEVRPTGFIQSGMPVNPYGFIWIDKYMWRVSQHCKTNNELFSIFGDPIVPLNRDIRFSYEHRPIIDAIFNTKELF